MSCDPVNHPRGRPFAKTRAQPVSTNPTEHPKLSEDPEAVMCPQCGQVCRNNSGLASHLRRRGTHDTPTPIAPTVKYLQPFECPSPGCKWRSSTTQAIDRHLDRAHNITTNKTRVSKRRKAKMSSNPEIPQLNAIRKQAHERNGYDPKRKAEADPQFKTRMGRMDIVDDMRDWRPLFLETYARTGYVGETLKTLRMPNTNYLRELANNPDFARAFNEISEGIKLERTEEALKAAWEDGVTGRYDDVYYEGVIVGHRLVRDTGQTQFLLKALAPETFDSSVRSTRIAGQALIMSQEERRAVIEETRRAVSEMVPGRQIEAPVDADIVDDVEEA